MRSWDSFLFHPYVKLQCPKGVPVIAVQVENEYGSYTKDVEYTRFIKEVGLHTTSAWLCVATFQGMSGHSVWSEWMEVLYSLDKQTDSCLIINVLAHVTTVVVFSQNPKGLSMPRTSWCQAAAMRTHQACPSFSWSSIPSPLEVWKQCRH